MTPRQSVWGTLIGVLAAVFALAYAQVVLPGQVLLSDYALVSGGLVPVLIGMLALAGACLCLAYGLAAVDASRSAASRVLLVAAAGGLMLSAVFPTDPGSSPVDTLPGQIHRWSAAVVFTSLPVAGWMLARARSAAPRWNAVRATSVASAAVLVIYLAAHPASFTSALIDGGSYYGLLERGVVLADMALLMVMAMAMRDGKDAARTGATPVTPDSRAGKPEDRTRLAA